MFLDSKHQRECNDNKVEKSLLTLCLHIRQTVDFWTHRAKPTSETERSGKVSPEGERVPWGKSSACLADIEKETHR